MSELGHIVGRTVVGVVEEGEYGDITLALDDGTHLRLQAEGYEADGIGVQVLDRAAQNARIRERMGDQHRRWLNGQIAAAKWAALPEAEKERQREHGRMMKRAMMNMWDATNMLSQQYNRQSWGAVAVVPVKSTSHATSQEQP